VYSNVRNVFVRADTLKEEKRLTSQNPSVEGVEGTNVTLRCDLNPPTNLSNFIVDVNRVDLDARNNLVHAVVRGRDHSRPQMGRYKNRTRFNHSDLNRGILEMTISSVTLADTGPYNFFIRELNVNCTINLTVVPKDKHNSTMGQDSTTTGHPGKDDGAAAKNESALAPDGGVVVFLFVFVAVVVVGGVLLILVKRGKIKNLLRTVNRRTDRDAEVAAGTELCLNTS
ncbi:uncharacterized protein LOC121939047, partial [Plectropomus leopardus]|uniref:uncharacterized protein LOC121939047 n=1 Tax=Plectropomus leopardus TaxID=160734 RepID=UPI001C4BC335